MLAGWQMAGIGKPHDFPAQDNAHAQDLGMYQNGGGGGGISFENGRSNTGSAPPSEPSRNVLETFHRLRLHPSYPLPEIPAG